MKNLIQRHNKSTTKYNYAKMDKPLWHKYTVYSEIQFIHNDNFTTTLPNNRFQHSSFLNQKWILLKKTINNCKKIIISTKKCSFQRSYDTPLFIRQQKTKISQLQSIFKLFSLARIEKFKSTLSTTSYWQTYWQK
jgi:hypothetical protein